MTAIGNPIVGVLHPYEWKRPAGNTEMKVTQTAAQHESPLVHVAGPPALDIGDGDPDLDAILAPHDAVVAQALTVGSANLSLDYTGGGKRWRIVLAHNTLPHPVAVGQAVREGQQVGRMGMTGATAIHLHIQLGWWDGTKWVWVDPWPYLRQNGATEENSDMLQGTNPRPVDNKRVFTSTGADDLRFRSSPFVRTDNVLAMLPSGTELHPDFVVDGTKVGAAADPRWYGAWAKTAAGIEFGYASVVFCSAPEPIETAGYTQAQLDAARASGMTAGADAVLEAAKAAGLKYGAS